MSFLTLAHVASASGGALVSYLVTAFLNSGVVANIKAQAATDLAAVKAELAALKAKV